MDRQTYREGRGEGYTASRYAVAEYGIWQAARARLQWRAQGRPTVARGPVRVPCFTASDMTEFIMRILRLLRPGGAALAASISVLVAGTVQASPAMGASPIVLAKSWMLGYALVFLCILLGLLAVTIPSMRKALRRKD